MFKLHGIELQIFYLLCSDRPLIKITELMFLSVIYVVVICIGNTAEIDMYAVYTSIKPFLKGHYHGSFV